MNWSLEALPPVQKIVPDEHTDVTARNQVIFFTEKESYFFDREKL